MKNILERKVKVQETMNSLSLQVTLLKRCFSLAPTISKRSLSVTRSLLNEEPKSAESETPNAADPSLIKGFYDRELISTPVFKALSKMNFKNFTPVQTQTIGPISTSEKGIVARAKTGTGKTIAFGLPLIEQALKRDPRDNKSVIGLVIAPTRDLAYQIRDELQKITKQFGRGTAHVNVHCLVGAESKGQQARAFYNTRTFPQIVVATPGRLFDQMENPAIQDGLKNLQFKVLDEADRLLDDGFKDSLLEIDDAIRQIKRDSAPEKTLLFSATIDKNVTSFARDMMGTNFTFIDTVDPNEPETHEKIEQSFIGTQNLFESFVSSTLFLANESKSNPNLKAIVFLPTVKAVSYYKEVLETYTRKNNLRLPVYQLHGKLTQAGRDRSVRNFRERSRGVLVTSDVGARGMDFPAVTNVVQIGVPTDTTNYVHRIGRTARGGKSGNALLVLSKAEAPFLKELIKRKINISSHFSYESIPESEGQLTECALEAEHKYSADQVIESLAGFYNGVLGNYHMNLRNVLAGLTASYSSLVGEENRRPKVGTVIWRKVLGMDIREAQLYFDTSRPSFGERGNDFDGESRGGYNNRKSDYGRSRSTGFNENYSDKRGGFAQRSYNNDNNSSSRYSNNRNSRSSRGNYGGNNNFRRNNNRNSERDSFGRDDDGFSF